MGLLVPSLRALFGFGFHLDRADGLGNLGVQRIFVILLWLNEVILLLFLFRSDAWFHTLQTTVQLYLLLDIAFCGRLEPASVSPSDFERPLDRALQEVVIDFEIHDKIFGTT